MYWAIAFGPLIQPFVQLFGIQSVGQALGTLGVIDVEEGIIHHLEGYAVCYQPLCQPVMAIEVDLQAKRCPGRHANITQPKGFIDEVEVIMEALAGCGFQAGMAPA